MKINLNPILYQRFNYKKNSDNKPNTVENSTISRELPGAEIPFCAMQGIKQSSKKDFSEDKNKLANTLKNMLNEVNKNSPEEISKELFSKYNKAFKNALKKRLNKFDFNKAEFLDENGELKLGTIFVNFIKDTEDVWGPLCIKINEEALQLAIERKENDKTDYELLSKFYTAVNDDNLNLDEIYKEHFTPLKEITKIKELQEKFPKITIPPKPEVVIGKRIVDTLNRDFFLEFNDLRENHSKKEAKEFFKEKFNSIIKQTAQNTNTDEEFLSKKLYKSTYSALLKKYENAKSSHGFNSLPQKIKTNQTLITPTDLKLLSINYDKLVLNVLSEQYLEGKKLPEITYTEGNTTISAGKLGHDGYKFEKPNEKIKAIIKQAKKIQQTERAYENFDSQYLRERLKYYSNLEISNHEDILNTLIDFDSSKIVEEDRKPLIELLRILDSVNDKKISIEEGAALIKEKNLKPLGTEKINQAEKEQMLNEIKKAQQLDAEFNKYTKEFDKTIALLFCSGMEEAATLCTTHRPHNINDSKTISDKIIKLIKSGLKNNTFINPKKTENDLKYLNKYYHYEMYDNQNPVYKKALDYSKTNGEIDEINAGHYLASSEIISQYPASLSIYKDSEKDIVKTICTKNSNPDEAVKNLIKFDDFRHLPQSEQLKISTILETFDINSNNEKQIIETIINNLYLQNSTLITTFLNKEKNLTTETELMPSAKIAIFEDKNFPQCLEYFETFERCMTRVAPSKEEDGIQVIGTNNKALRKLYKQEVKIPMEERLYSTNGDYKFDVYKPGLHKRKNSKA